MGRQSSIKELDPRIREAVDKAVREDRATLDDIVALINDMGGEASRSAVGRYVKNAKQQMERFREAQQVAKVWVGKLEEDPESDVGRLLSEMLRTVAFQTLGTMDDTTQAGDIMFLAKAIKELASADKISVDRELKIRQEVAKKAADKAANIAKKSGMSEEVIQQIRREALGVAK